MENNKYCCDDFHKKPIMIIVSLFLIVLVVFFGVKVANEIKTGKYIGMTAGQNIISVSGEGEVYVKPDLGIIVFTVANEAKTVDTAMSENTAKMNNVIAAIKGQGVEEKDIKTTNFNINPRYEYPKTDLSASYYYSGKRVLVGYEITQSVQVKIRDLTKTGTLITKVTEAGANDVGDLTFTVDDEDAAKKEARDQAIAKAKEKAQQLAEKLGVRLTRIVNFYENSYPVYNYDTMYKSAISSEGMGGITPSPSIETGENRITATVTISYEIN